MRRPILAVYSIVLAAILVAGSSLVTAPASAAPIAGAPTTYCSDPDTDPSVDTGAGTMIRCVTTITNTVTGIDPITGVATGSAVVSVTECTGPADGRLDPSVLTCTTDEQVLAELVVAVDQCNGVGYGGGNVLECSVEVSNYFVGVTPEAIGAATVNQCNGSAPDTTGCDPSPATTSGATITQCNNSSYGGGQEDFNCTASGTTTASLAVTVTQCNDSNYGGGSWLNCSASVTSEVVGLASPSPSTSSSVAPVASTSASPIGEPTAAPSTQPTPAPSAGPTAEPTAQPTTFPTDGATAGPSGAAASAAATPTRSLDLAVPTNGGSLTTARPSLDMPETATDPRTRSAVVPFGLLVAVLLVGGVITFGKGITGVGR